MNRKILIQMTAPAVLIGLVLFGASLASVWYINRLQTNLANILSKNVASQQAAQGLEIEVRRLRFHSFHYLLDPTPERLKLIHDDHARIEEALRIARESVATDEERDYLAAVDDGYRQYRRGINELLAADLTGDTRKELAQRADAHPVQLIVEPLQKLLLANKKLMEGTSDESLRVTRQANLTMILLGILGPAGGLLVGFGCARALSRSIYRLGVRVRDVTNRLDQDVASVSIEADGDIQGLDRQLEQIVRRVEEVTERQQQHQRELLRAEQLSAVGQLAASVAHEVRNPLVALKVLVEIALLSENKKPLGLPDLRVMHREVTRLEQTVQGFLDFARPSAPQRSDCDLCQMVNEAVGLVQPRARQQRVEMVVNLPQAGVKSHIDQGQIRTVLVNLLLNALDAMPQGGQLVVRMACSPHAPSEDHPVAWTSVHANDSRPDGIRLIVEDTGAGIAPEVIDRLFTPFVSTKPTGTGLGLTISRRIVEEHGGTLVGNNRPEGGACFTILLPATEANDQKPAS